MFEDSTNFDFDDDGLLKTSFTPAISSTQTSPAHKRPNDELNKENLKKVKLFSDVQDTTFRECDAESLSNRKETESLFVPFNSPKRVIRRKFPGPAGLLPERTASNKSILELIADKTADTQDEFLLCSQQTVSVFEDGPWKYMTKDFYSPSGECLYEKFNINWIKKQASLKKLLVNHKAPFLAAVIQSLEIFDGRVPTVNVTLKDATGEIQGTILHSLYEEYSNFFTVGSVLVLKQFGVLSAGYNNHCLTITPNNLVTIYSLQVPKKPPNDVSNHIAGKSDGGSIEKVAIQDCKVDEIMKKYNEDVLTSELKQKSINFETLRQNHSSLLRHNSAPDNRSILACTRSLLQQNNNNESQKGNLGVLKFQNNFSRTFGENNSKSNIAVETLSAVRSSDNNLKKRFNFKQSGCLQTTSYSGSKGLVEDDGHITFISEKDTGENRNCDVVVSNSQISVKSASKEHTEIWKNLLQDVDADSLFDDF